MYIQDAWYAAALSGEIKREPFARSILNEKVVMYRTSTEQVVALEDRCAHRQVPLSRGRLVGDELQCWYHGLRYDCSGACVSIPSQSTIPINARVRSFPVVEKHGFIWLWPGDPAKADEASIPDHWVCAAPELAGKMSYCTIDCNYLFGIDNILDISHAAFVHQKTLGSLDIVETPPEILIGENEVRVRRYMRREKTPPLYTRILQMEYIDRSQEVLYWPIGNTRVETRAHACGDADGKVYHVYTTTIFTPATDTTSHVFVGMHRDFDVDNHMFTEFTAKEVYSTVMEDKDVAESLQANWSATAPMIDIQLDRPAYAARRILERMGATAAIRATV
ncbi:aromatic ring-hydroxylating dioxygenase subunit alpha [Pseudoduganella chitinolytica]|uniref:Aromatic ring-hydroxylating dioxygenase subunit alpha n=1 Tax=Pseudoduganella chitinolytica TaxID=34070 RepID=A0ABY8BA35_9BURK|nr:aromatic ring-hydroxylating dioxygenase subunit alpha [Pseudoduganella chitinolytica]WEF32576.1 aromatic ring-hydroxylating dioxygenase subunit alpha [Pseudoduganella chitinolytica]